MPSKIPDSGASPRSTAVPRTTLKLRTSLLTWPRARAKCFLPLLVPTRLRPAYNRHLKNSRVRRCTAAKRPIRNRQQLRTKTKVRCIRSQRWGLSRDFSHTPPRHNAMSMRPRVHVPLPPQAAALLKLTRRHITLRDLSPHHAGTLLCPPPRPCNYVASFRSPLCCTGIYSSLAHLSSLLSYLLLTSSPFLSAIQLTVCAYTYSLSNTPNTPFPKTTSSPAPVFLCHRRVVTASDTVRDSSSH